MVFVSHLFLFFKISEANMNYASHICLCLKIFISRRLLGIRKTAAEIP